MSTSKEERDRILALVEMGQLNAVEAAQLLDTLEEESDPIPGRLRERIVRVHATSINPQAPKVNLTANIPLRLLKISVRLGAFTLPPLSKSALDELLRSIENGATGRLLDLQDLEQGYRIEIFVE